MGGLFARLVVRFASFNIVPPPASQSASLPTPSQNLQVVKVLLKSDFFGFLPKNVFTFAS